MYISNHAFIVVTTILLRFLLPTWCVVQESNSSSCVKNPSELFYLNQRCKKQNGNYEQQQGNNYNYTYNNNNSTLQTVICITVRRRRWHLVHLCAVHTTHNSSHLADCVSSPGRLPSDHVREYMYT